MKLLKPVGLTVALIVGALLVWTVVDPMKPADKSGDRGSAPSAASSGTATSSGNARAGGGNGSGGGSGPGAGGGGRPAALVVAQPVTDALINDRLKAVGSATALASVSVVPLSSGLLTDVLVSSGQRVKKGAVLAMLDDEEQIIARDRAARSVENVAIDEARLARLYQSRTTTEVELIKVRADLADAKLALREAELTLARRRITAPIAGVVGLVAVDKGNYVTTQTEIVTIDDRSTLIIEFWVPERFASQVSVGQTVEATAQADPSRNYIGTITGIGSRVETDSRTLPVQAQTDNADDSLRPGMSFNLSLNFKGQTFPAVDPLAIQWDSNGSFVWRVVSDKVERVPVQIIQRNPESVLVASELAIGDAVVTEGLMALRPGAAVRLQGRSRPGSDPAVNGQTGKGQTPAADGQSRTGEISATAASTATAASGEGSVQVTQPQVTQP